MSPERVWTGARLGLNFIPLFTILDTPQLPHDVGIDLTESSEEKGKGKPACQGWHSAMVPSRFKQIVETIRLRAVFMAGSGCTLTSGSGASVFLSYSHSLGHVCI